MAGEVEIEALKPFNRTPQGQTCGVGDRFPVSASRADELERLGLAKRSAEAPAPENKMLPDTREPRAASKRRSSSDPEKD